MIAYDRLSAIIPPGIALANKALSVSLAQISGIPNMGLPAFATAVKATNSNQGLPAINQQKQPLPTATKNYLLASVGVGTGPCGSITIEDCLGTVTGWVVAANLNSTTTQISSMNTANLQLGYQNVINCMSGAYDYHVPNPAYDPMLPPGPGNLEYLGWACIVPSGPGAGDYRIYATQADARNAAISAIVTNINTVVVPGLQATYPTQTALMNTNFGNICQQMGNEQDLQKRAGLDFANFFANLQPNSQTAVFSFAMGLPGYGQNIQQGGTRQFLEALADYNPTTGTITAGSKTVTSVSTFTGISSTGVSVNISGNGIPENNYVTNVNTGAKTITMNAAATLSIGGDSIIVGNIGGQAIIATMRTGQTQAAFNTAGILTASDIPLIPNPAPTPATNLLPSTYTTQQAISQIQY
jgi:hypothetical protein